MVVVGLNGSKMTDYFRPVSVFFNGNNLRGLLRLI